jgi:hypothetical protein
VSRLLSEKLVTHTPICWAPCDSLIASTRGIVSLRLNFPVEVRSFARSLFVPRCKRFATAHSYQASKQVAAQALLPFASTTMAAAQPPLVASFMRLSFTEEAATAMVEDLGINDVSVLRLMDAEEAKTVCKTLRRPGGTMLNDDDELVPNPGTAVSPRAEASLILLVFWARHQRRISREFGPEDITLGAVTSLQELFEDEAKVKDTTDKPTISHDNWHRNMTAIVDYLKLCYGRSNIPLAYVVRDNVAVPDEEDDPRENYNSAADEMIAQAPHEGTTFNEDNRKVYRLIKALLDKVSIIHIEPAAQSENGRRAFLLLRQHYCGLDAVSVAIRNAERAITQASYKGDDRKFTFDKYAANLKQQFTILDDLASQALYSGVDEHSKVRILLDGMVGERYDSVRSTVAASSELQSDFEKTVSLIKSTYGSSLSKRAQLNVSSVEVDGNGQVPWVENDAFRALPKEQRKAIALKRAELKRKEQGKGKGKKAHKKGTQPNFKKQNHHLKRQVASLEAKLKVLSTDSPSDDDVSMESAAGGNRNNSALTRNKSKGGKK